MLVMYSRRRQLDLMLGLVSMYVYSNDDDDDDDDGDDDTNKGNTSRNVYRC